MLHGLRCYGGRHYYGKRSYDASFIISKFIVLPRPINSSSLSRSEPSAIERRREKQRSMRGVCVRMRVCIPFTVIYRNISLIQERSTMPLCEKHTKQDPGTHYEYNRYNDKIIII